VVEFAADKRRRGGNFKKKVVEVVILAKPCAEGGGKYNYLQ
jgi:hypothetical protein